MCIRLGASPVRLCLRLPHTVYCVVWLERLLGQIQQHPGPILLEGGEAYGVSHLIKELGHRQRVAWMQISPAESGDGIALGNMLAEAVNNALRATLLPHALPFSFGIDLLKSQLPQVGP